MNNSIFITGSSGFVGKNLLQQFKNIYTFSKFEKGSAISIRQDVVLHLAGKAHDLQKVNKPSEYYKVNTEFSNEIFDHFLDSDAEIFITLSSVAAVSAKLDVVLTEKYIPNPITHYGKSKLLAEEYILSKQIPVGKRVYILRPCIIHGPENKGNLNLLYKIVRKGLPWPLGSFDNKRSFCSIDNICFIIKELIDNDKIPSGVYNIADDEPISTNDLIKLIAVSLSKKPLIFNTPKFLVKGVAKFGDALKLPLNTERLGKLTETFIVSNKKIKNAIKKPLPVSTIEGLLKTFNSFNNAK